MSGAVTATNAPLPVEGVGREADRGRGKEAKQQLRLTPIERQFLPAALEILDTPASPVGRAVAATISAFLLIALGWSIIGRVDIIATAPGFVIPAGKSKLVQPLESGVVSAILVNDGDHVRAGQVLFRLDPTAAAAERDRIARELRQAELDAAGLRALQRDLEMDGGGAESFIPPDGAPAAEVARTRAAIAARSAEQRAKVAALDQQIAGKQAEQAENVATIAKLTAMLPWLEQKASLRRELLHVQFGNRLAWLDAEQELAEQRGAREAQRLHGPEVEAALRALMRQREQTMAGYTHDVLTDLAQAEEKLGTLRQQLAAAAHKAEQTVLAAPIDGTAQQLAVHTVGGVVTSAQALLTVVPDDAPVLIEASVDNKDIGFVHAGQDVEVKVQTFEFTRYGLLHGQVLDVSRDRVGDQARTKQSDAMADAVTGSEQGSRPPDQPGYVAHVALDRTRMLVDGVKQPVSPGMAVTAEIKTGRRSVISYLLSPLNRYAHEGIRER